MSIKIDRSKLKHAITGREYKLIQIKDLYPPYWDEGMDFYPKYRPGYKNPNKLIERYQVRMYKTWKHTRNKQYKNIDK